jgi:SAM-dependent methyltransferase
VVGGFTAFAPDLASDNTGFREEYFADLAGLEADNFWFRARNDLIAWAMKSYVPDCTSFLEVGCGTGFVLNRLRSEFPSMTLAGSEIFTAGLEFAAQRVPSATFYQMDARHIPFRSEFDAIGAFDVLEHIVADEAVIAEVGKALRPGGAFLATVPQHRALWSEQDVHAHHVRRYSQDGLRRKIEAAGFEIVRLASFVSLLLPMMLVSRMRMTKATEDFDASDALRLPEPVNTAFEAVMRVERAMTVRGISFPAGGSLLVVARKRQQARDAA